MSLDVARMRYQKRGFRAKISSGWFVWRGTTPIAGPFTNKSVARTNRDRIEEAEAMQNKERAQDGGGEVVERETTKETEKTSEKRESKSDPSDNARDDDSTSDGEKKSE
jgi:hypothetical protein